MFTKISRVQEVQPGGSSRALCVMARATLVKFAKNEITFNYQRKPAHPLINEILTYLGFVEQKDNRAPPPPPSILQKLSI